MFGSDAVFKGKKTTLTTMVHLDVSVRKCPNVVSIAIYLIELFHLFDDTPPNLLDFVQRVLEVQVKLFPEH